MTPSAHGFTPDELDTWSAVATLLEWLPAALDTQLRADAGISHFEFGILFALSRADGHALRVSELADFANGTLSRLSRALTRLEGHGWVTRATDPTDGRVTIATLTPHGLAAQRAAEPGHVALVRRLVFEQLTPAQSTELAASARLVSSAIRPGRPWRPPGGGDDGDYAAAEPD